jgi:hypothetical protein
MSAPETREAWNAFFAALEAQPYKSGIEAARERLAARKHIRNDDQWDVDMEADNQRITARNLLR